MNKSTAARNSAIIRMRNKGVFYKHIAICYGVSPVRARQIVEGEKYKYLPNGLNRRAVNCLLGALPRDIDGVKPDMFNLKPEWVKLIPREDFDNIWNMGEKTRAMILQWAGIKPWQRRRTRPTAYVANWLQRREYG